MMLKTKLIFPALAGILLAGTGLPASAAVDAGLCSSFEQKAATLKRDDSYQLNGLLINAARHGCLPLVQTLLNHGANIEGRDRVGATALMRAAGEGQDQVVTYLLNHGADVDTRAVAGSTALFFAAEGDRLTTIKLLLQHKASVDQPGRGGNRALAAAAYRDNLKALNILVEAGADVNAMDDSGKTAMVYAAALGYRRIVARLLELGVDINHKYGHDLTALMWAAGYSSGTGVDDAKDVVSYLLAHGANPQDKDDRGKTAFDIAMGAGHAEVAALLKPDVANNSAKP